MQHTHMDACRPRSRGQRIWASSAERRTSHRCSALRTQARLAYPLNTIAGSSTSTRRTLRRLEIRAMTITATAVRTSTCPGHEERQLRLVLRELTKRRGHADTQTVADQTDDEGLQQDHRDDAGVAHTHRLQRAELAHVLDRERVERLPDDGGADQKPEQHRGMPKLMGIAGLFQVVPGSRGPGELLASQACRPVWVSMLTLPGRWSPGSDWARMNDITFRSGGTNDAPGCRVDDRKRLERLRRLAHTHDHGPSVVHLKRGPARTARRATAAGSRPRR